MYAGKLAPFWNDHACSFRTKYICEKEEGTLTFYIDFLVFAISMHVITIIVWLRQMKRADWLIGSPENVILPTQEIHLAHSCKHCTNKRNLKLTPYNHDENHSPSEFYHPEQTNDPNKYGSLAAKAFFDLFYKVATNCRSVRESIAFGFDRNNTPLEILSHTDLSDLAPG